MAQIVVFGCGDVAATLQFFLEHDSPHEVVAFTVDAAYRNQDTHMGLPVVAFEEVEAKFGPSDHELMIPLGFAQMNALRADKCEAAKAKGYRLGSYVSSKAATWPGLDIGENTMIYENVTVHPFTKIGNDVVIAPNSVIAHHCQIGDHTYIAAGVAFSSSVIVEPSCVLGAGAAIRDRVTLGKATLVGAGATVMEDTEPESVYMGEPADRMGMKSTSLPLT
ncbi:MAG: acetyltransferase [Myxococcota bacterium]